MPVDHVYLQAPYGGEIREVEATPDVLVPLLVQGWYQVPAPADREAVAPIGIIEDAEQRGVASKRNSPKRNPQLRTTLSAIAAKGSSMTIYGGETQP